MPDIGEFLSAKRMGAPTWLWATGAVALVSFGYLYYKNKKAATTTATTSTTGSAAAGTVAGITQPTGYPASVNTSTSNYFTNPSAPAATSSTPTWNMPDAIGQLNTTTYTVTGKTSPAGYPDTQLSGIASIIQNSKDPASYIPAEVTIEFLNPALPFVNNAIPVGSVVTVPSGGDKSGYVPTGAPQTTSLTTTTAAGTPATSNTGGTVSASGN